MDIAEIEISHANQTIDGYRLVALPASRALGVSFPMQNDTGEKSLKGDPIGNNVTADIAIRKALNIGIDRKALLEGVLSGKGDVEYTGVDQREYGNPEARITRLKSEEAKKYWRMRDGKTLTAMEFEKRTELKHSLNCTILPMNPIRQALSCSCKRTSQKIRYKNRPCRRKLG